ncbi:MAG TPA: hypothetical protein VGY66_31420 [Gemmataceae bacterium]|jgi:hypothetical protein|nr:hypothetical protein [Gemmataceae bacterium]
MNEWIRFLTGVLLILLLAGPPALPCDLCNPGKATTTLREDAAKAKLILFGKLANARLDPASDGGGATDLQIEKVLKDDPWLRARKVVEIPRYVRLDPGTDHFLIFCDIFRGKLDPFRGQPASAEVIGYVQKASVLDARDRTKTLLFYFDYLDHTNRQIANDAFAEFTHCSDAEIGQVAGKLSPAKLRRWLQDAQTPAERLGLYSFLLGGCGGDHDAALLRALIAKSGERTGNALGGLLSGYIHLRPREGWKLAETILTDKQRPFAERYAVIGMLRFYHGWKPEETRADVMRCLAVLVGQGDMADIAVEDLRRWEMWSLCVEVLGQFPKQTHAAPIVRRAIVRYALSCPKPEAKSFIAELRKTDADIVGDVEESLRFEKQK